MHVPLDNNGSGMHMNHANGICIPFQLPFLVKGIPFEAKGIPFEAGGIPFLIKGIPFLIKGIPF
ncbi:hypothetical protein PilKf_01723 [Pillotina sp. SPG140]